MCEYANHMRCSDGVGKRTAVVGRHKGNAFGLYDMHGNVWEWVEDCWHMSYVGAPTDGSAWTAVCSENARVLRAGSWDILPQVLRSAIRYRGNPTASGSTYGFRVARALDENARAGPEAERLAPLPPQVKKAGQSTVKPALEVALLPEPAPKSDPTAEQYVAKVGGAKIVPAGELYIDNRKVTCGQRPTVLDDSLDDYASAYPGFLVLNSKLLAKVSTTVKLWAHAQVCGYQYHGNDGKLADCFAVQRGLRQG